MNTSQMNCFLAAAECLCFTQAAERMYLSQSGLSRQIAAMEREMGVELFKRGRNSIRLTESGKICADYLSKIRFDLQKMFDEAALAQHIQYSSFSIGGLEGQLVGEFYDNALIQFWRNNPDIKIKMCYCSVSELRRALVEGEVDIGFLPEAEAERLPGIAYKRSRMEKGGLVVPRNHPKANMKNLTLRDFEDETFLVLAESDSDVIATHLRESFQQAGIEPKQHSVPTFGTLVMMLEMGAGISIMNAWNSLRHAPHLKFLQLNDIYEHIEAVAWNKDNKNPNIPKFLDLVRLEKK